jgi:adenylate cyclase
MADLGEHLEGIETPGEGPAMAAIGRDDPVARSVQGGAGADGDGFLAGAEMHRTDHLGRALDAEVQDPSLWRRELEAAISEAKASLVLDPNHSPGFFLLGWALHYSGEQEEAIEQFKNSMRLDPHYPGFLLHVIAQAYFAMGQFDEAVALLARILRDPGSDISRVLLASCYGHLGQAERARSEWAAALQINPEYSLDHRRRVLPYKDPGAFERVVDGLRKAGLPE